MCGGHKFNKESRMEMCRAVGVEGAQYPSLALVVALYCDERTRFALKQTCRLMWANIK